MDWTIKVQRKTFPATGLNQSLFFLSAATEEPEFVDQIENVTVAAGRNVKLACSVKNLGSFKVSFRILKHPLLSFHKKKVDY